MGWLDRFIGNLGHIGQDAAEADSEILGAWKKYIESIPEKEKIIHSAVIDLLILKNLLRTELVDLEDDEKAKIEVIKDLDSFSHDHRIKSAHRLTQALYYAERKYDYVYSLVKEIYSAIKREFHLASALGKQENDRTKLLIHFQEQVELEITIIRKINEINEQHGPNRFHELFMDLARGEQFIKKLNVREHWLLRKMKARSDRIDESLLNQWGARVIQQLEDRVHEAEAQGLL